MKALRLRWLLAFAAVFLLHREPLASIDATVALPAAIQRDLELADPTMTVGNRPVDLETLRTFYQQREGQPVWVDGSGITPRGQVLLQSFRDAGLDGLDPANYESQAMIAPPDATDRLATSELMLSSALLRYAVDIRQGRAAPEQVERDQRNAPPPIDALAVLDGAASSLDLPAYMASLAPSDPFYQGLRLALQQYRAIAAAGGWPAIEDGPKLGPGSSGPRVRELRQRLQLSGDMPVEAVSRAPDRYDDALRQDVRLFQQRHGLPANGVVGPGTLSAMNVPVEARLRQIKLNLERARWLPDDLGNPYVLVNMAAFELDVVQDGHSALSMRVVVGERDKETPVFSDAISYLELNPYWNVPRSIAVKEKLPLLRRNPSALAAQNIRVFGPGGEQINPASVDWSSVGSNFPYRLRQDPGERNALGRIKFMFPNPYDVYLHDTPSRALFSKPVRAFSHGCIRVEKPMELAEFLLQGNPDWSRQRIESTIASGKNRAVTLEQPVPVHIVYLTAWLDAEARVQFRDDFYNRDAHLVAVLDAKGE